MGQNINVFCVFFSFNLYCRNLNHKDVSEGDLNLWTPNINQILDENDENFATYFDLNVLRGFPSTVRTKCSF